MRVRVALGAVLLVVLAAVAATGVATAAPGNHLTCSGGFFDGNFDTAVFTPIHSGNYASITVTGVCNIDPNAVINVSGNIDVAPGGLLDAQSAPATITVGHNVTAGAGSLLGLGCQPSDTIGKFGAGVPCAGPMIRTGVHRHHHQRERHRHERERRSPARSSPPGVRRADGQRERDADRRKQ